MRCALGNVSCSRGLCRSGCDAHRALADRGGRHREAPRSLGDDAKPTRPPAFSRAPPPKPPRARTPPVHGLAVSSLLCSSAPAEVQWQGTVNRAQFPARIPTPAVPHTTPQRPTPLRLDRDDHLPRAEVTPGQLAAAPPEAPAAGFPARRRPYTSIAVVFAREYRRIGGRTSRVSTTPRARGAETAPPSPCLSLLLSPEGSS